MIRNWINSIAITLLALIILASCNQRDDHTAHADTYTCPMHPTVISDRPGACPVCGMDLVRKARPGEEVTITEDLARLIKSPNEVVISSVRTIKGEYRSVPISVQAQGIVTYDTRNIYTIPARFGGRLEKVYLKYAYQPVRKGQKVAAVYSPELLAAQRELLYLVESDAENTALINAARNKLALLGISGAQIDALIRTKEPVYAFTIFSPYDGYVVPRGEPSGPGATGSPSGTEDLAGGGMDMGRSAAPINPTATAPVQDISLLGEGSYVAAGQTLFTIVNTAALRVELDVPASQAATIAKGDTVQLMSGNRRIENASVGFVQPFFAEGSEFLKVRVYLSGKHDLHIGELVKATIQLRPSEALWVPKAAVLDLGLDRIVFVKDRGILKPRRITTGISTGELVEITQGLSSADEIAANAQYLVDSESFIKTEK